VNYLSFVPLTIERVRTGDAGEERAHRQGFVRIHLSLLLLLFAFARARVRACVCVFIASHVRCEDFSSDYEYS